MGIPPQLMRLLRAAANVSALTGAGVSRESGLRTFRDPLDGLWAQYRPETLATPEAFERNPELVWKFYSNRRMENANIQPNAGHFALAELEHLVQNFTLITQNVDGLHQRAGSKCVIELHGNISRVKCSRGCGIITKWEETEGCLPTCSLCGGKLRPDVVWFGENLPGRELDAAIQAAHETEVFLAVGTSGLVQPAASLPLIARQNGAVIVEINLEETPLTPFAKFYLQGKSGEILPDLVKAAWG
jgi:NAD-dependent deacetylase